MGTGGIETFVYRMVSVVCMGMQNLVPIRVHWWAGPRAGLVPGMTPALQFKKLSRKLTSGYQCSALLSPRTAEKSWT